MRKWQCIQAGQLKASLWSQSRHVNWNQIWKIFLRSFDMKMKTGSRHGSTSTRYPTAWTSLWNGYSLNLLSRSSLLSQNCALSPQDVLNMCQWTTMAALHSVHTITFYIDYTSSGLDWIGLCYINILVLTERTNCTPHRWECLMCKLTSSHSVHFSTLGQLDRPVSVLEVSIQ